MQAKSGGFGTDSIRQETLSSHVVEKLAQAGTGVGMRREWEAGGYSGARRDWDRRHGHA